MTEKWKPISGFEGRMRAFIDFETRSACDIKKRGGWVYSEHPTTEVLCLAWKWENTKTQIWIPGYPTDWIAEGINRATEIFAHNASFELAIWMNVCVKKYGWPALPLEKLRCSAAKAAMHSLPRSLEGAGAALGLRIQKDMEGHRLMMKLCRPRKPRKGEPEINPNDPHGYYWNEDPAELDRLYKYCMNDVIAEEALSNHLSDLPEKELLIWQLDQLINMRGIQADVPSAKAMLAMVGEHEAKLLERLRLLTHGNVKTAKQVEALRKYLRALGVDLPDLSAATVKSALKKEMSDDAKSILEIRRSLGRSSSAKYQAIIDRASGDGRVRGSLLYHGAGTGRWAGSGIQPQNFPSRIKINADPEAILGTVNIGGLKLFNALFDDDPMAAAGAVTRSVLTASPGAELVVADYSAVEGRGLAWLAGEETELEVYRSDKDVYIYTAASILHKYYENVTKDERSNPGKVATLACIAEGSLVLTDHGLVPIEKVSCGMRVWDGVEWVAHDGPVYRGMKEVIEHDGLQATPDHMVFTEEGKAVELQEATRTQQRLAQTGSGRSPIRLGEDNFSRHRNAKPAETACSMPMPGVPGSEVDRPDESFSRENRRVPEMQPAPRNSEMAPEENVRGEGSLPESRQPAVQKLRSPGNRIPIQDGDRCGIVGDQESGTGSKTGAGPDRQRRALRTRESSVVNASTERVQHEESQRDLVCIPPIQGTASRDQIRRQHSAESAVEENDIRPDRSEMESPELQTKRPVWDILNAGPRHRFTVSGKLVHNCGYGGGAGAVRKFNGHELIEEELKRQGLKGERLEEKVDEKILEQIVRPWREAHPRTVQFWGGLETACMSAVREPGKVCFCRAVGFRVQNRFLMCRLPSGRILYYYDPQIEPVVTSWGETKDSVTYMTVDGMTKKWIRTNTYGGKLAENVTQAICRDLMAEAMLRVEKAGYEIVLTVHDELVCEVPEGFGSVEELEKLMCIVPPWAAGFPVKAEGFRTKRYRK